MKGVRTEGVVYWGGKEGKGWERVAGREGNVNT